MRYTGCRPNEAGGFLKKNIFWDRKEFALATVLGKGKVVKTNTKNKREKMFPFIPELRDGFEKAKNDPSEFVFNMDGRPYTIRRLEKIWDRANQLATEKYGTPRIRLYQGLKHSFVSQRLEEDYTYDQISEVLGVSPEMVRTRYGKYQTGKLVNIMRGKMMGRYLEEHVSQKKSARAYEGYVSNLLAFFGEDVLISEMTPSMINEFKMKRRRDGVKSGTINRDLSILKNCFNIAMKQWEWVDSNPVTRIPMEKEPPGRVRFLTDEEFERLCDACPEWLKPIVLTARHTGMRKENILSLKWNQVDLFRRVINLEQTKNNERLCIPINDTLMELFKRLAKVRHIKSQYVFFHPNARKRNAKGTFNGKRYYEVKKSFQKALKEAGIEDFRFHDLRHCFASDLVQRGVDLYLVQKLLGHKSQTMTQRYAHLTPENLRDAVLKLDEKINTNLRHSEKEASGQGS